MHEKGNFLVHEIKCSAFTSAFNSRALCAIVVYDCVFVIRADASVSSFYLPVTVL